MSKEIRLFEQPTQTREKKLVKYYLRKENQPVNIPDIKITEARDFLKILSCINELEGNDIQEMFLCCYFNRANKFTGYTVVSMGGVTGTVADPRLIVKGAAMADCCSVVLSHNHPSGNIKPSRADEELTGKLKQALLYFDIRILDHIITTGVDSPNYLSFAEEGLL